MKQAYIIRSVIYILLQSIVYGFGNPLTKTAYESITPFWCLFFRFSLPSLSSCFSSENQLLSS